MAHEPEKRVELRGYYLGGLTLITAANRAGVPIDTARRWKRLAGEQGDDWDRLRGATLLAGGSVDEVLSRVLAVTIRQAESTIEILEKDDSINALSRVQAIVSLSDSLNKMAAASRRLMPETDELAVRMDTIKELSEFVRKRYPSLANQWLEIFEAFGNQK